MRGCAEKGRNERRGEGLRVEGRGGERPEYGPSRTFKPSNGVAKNKMIELNIVP